MEPELIKPVVRAGNSACVILPKKWLGGKAKIELIEDPVNIEVEIFEILKFYLKDILGIYLTGSYARGENTPDSDIDVLVITHNTNKTIIEGKYDIILISQENLEKTLKRNILPLLPMIKESKTILNGELIEKYKKIALNKSNLK